jgi:ABC-2 type transport system ATP-binding protein
MTHGALPVNAAARGHGRRMDGTDAAIEVEGLGKRYGGRVVLDGVSLRVATGEVVALLGPNGAGKTTLVEILEGYRRPDAGSARVLGGDPWRDAARLRQRVGLMLQEGGIYPAARPREVLRLFASFYTNPDDPDRLLEMVGLTGVTTPYRRLSGGQKQRLALALALVGRPTLLFLDEPTAGMDPRARRTTWEMIERLGADGATVLLTTQSMEEAERLAGRIAILHRGHLVAVGTLAELRGEGANAVRLLAPAGLPLAAMAALAGVLTAREQEPGRYIIEASEPPAALAALTAWAYREGIAIREMRVGRESLEEIYLRLTGGSTGETA